MIPEHTLIYYVYTHPGKLPSIWYSHPPFRVHHEAKETIELEWNNECEGTGSNIISVGVIYQPGGSYLIQVLTHF